MTGTLAIGGWAAATIACMGVAIARRALLGRMEQVARACHELRGPITAVRLGLELGSRPGALSPARLRALDLELGRAALAIDDLAEIRAGHRPPGAHEVVDLRSLLADSVEAWRSCAEVHGATLRLVWSGDRVHVAGNRLRLAQAIGNLIANAIAHGGGAVEVSVIALSPGAGQRPPGPSPRTPARGGMSETVWIEFVDDGPGLPAPVAELARRGRHRRDSHGHGLAIATAVALSHGGRLGGAPSDRGARVVLELPVTPRRARAQVVRPAADDRPA